MKLALDPILRALAEEDDDGIPAHTGQHYDYEMSGSFFGDLEKYGTWRSVSGQSGPSNGPRH